MNIKSFAACAIAAVMTCVSIGCNKGVDHNDPTPTPTPTAVDSGKISMHIHTYIGEEEVDGYNINYTLADGRKISLSQAQFYVSDIQLIKSDGSSYAVPGRMFLKTLEEESYLVSNVPVGTYKAVKFKVGLDATTNAMDATSSTALNHPEMWFGGTAQPDGYVFLNAQGKIDTTADASGTAAQMQPFVYKIGTTAHYVQVTMPDHSPAFTITKGNGEFIHMLFDYSKLFSGVQLNNPTNLSVNTKGDNSSAISNTISNNISGAFRYEE